MQISQFFINGDMKGAIAYMREHPEFQDVLPAYTAIFEKGEYRTFEVPDRLNELLRLYTGIPFMSGCRRWRPPTSCWPR